MQGSQGNHKVLYIGNGRTIRTGEGDVTMETVEDATQLALTVEEEIMTWATPKE